MERAAPRRYANPAAQSQTHRCTISRCLLAVEAALDNFEYDVASSNKVTPEEIKCAKASRDELYSSKALDLLVDQLKAANRNDASAGRKQRIAGVSIQRQITVERTASAVAKA